MIQIKSIRNTHYHWLDALRFIAALTVVLSHTRNDLFVMYGDLPIEYHTIPSLAFYLLGKIGHEAVIVFFVLSGFLVGGRALEKISNNTFDVRSYSIDRFSRIYPPLIAAIILDFVVYKIIGMDFPFWVALGNLLNLQGICCGSLVSPFWSLNYEVWFYIIIGSYGAIRSHSHKSQTIGICVFSFSIMMFMMGLSLHYLAIWIIGAVSYLCKPSRPNKLLKYLSFLLIVACVALYRMAQPSNSIAICTPITNCQLIETLMAFFMALFIQQIILCEPKNKVSKFVENRLGKMANFSYTLYLSHRVFMLLLFAFFFEMKSAMPNSSGLLMWLELLLILLFLCWLLYLVSERYSPQIRRMLKKNIIKA